MMPSFGDSVTEHFTTLFLPRGMVDGQAVFRTTVPTRSATTRPTADWVAGWSSVFALASPHAAMPAESARPTPTVTTAIRGGRLAAADPRGALTATRARTRARPAQ